MKLIDEHINECLRSYIETCASGFEQVYENISSVEKDRAKFLLIYVDKLLNHTLNQNINGLNYCHIHFEGGNKELIQLIAEFIVVKLYFIELYNDKFNNGNNYLLDIIDSLTRRTCDPNLPAGVKSGSKKLTLFLNEKKKLKSKKIFFENILSLNSNASLAPVTLINTLNILYGQLENVFEVKPFGVKIERIPKERSYVALNTESIDTIKSIKYENDFLLKKIKNIVLIDCESRSDMIKFNFSYLSNLNKSSKTNFRNLHILSFSDSSFDFNNLKSRLERIESRFYSQPKYPNYQTYTVTENELNWLLKEKQYNSIQIKWYKVNYDFNWDEFKAEIGGHEGLYELRSLKLMNVYSLVLNTKLKQIVLNDIFSFDQQPQLITPETRAILEELSEESIFRMKETLSNTLENVLTSGWKYFLQNYITPTTTLLIPPIIKKFPLFNQEIIRELNLNKSNKISTWQEADIESSGHILILDYRDCGPFPYIIQPNVFINPFKNASLIESIHIDAFFENKFNWTFFNKTFDTTKILNHPLRKKYFKWNELVSKVLQSKPQREDINWNLERNYSAERDIPSIKIKLKGNNRERSRYPSELCIVKHCNTNHLKVMRLEEILEEGLDDIGIELQILDEIYAELNLYEKIANLEREENELELIRKQYNLNNKETPGRLWKVLLKRICEQNGVDIAYGQLKELAHRKGLVLVSRNTFEHVWINPDSDTLLPREKNVFYVLCDYLRLPITYFRIMLRLKNAERTASRNSSKQMDALLSDLINDGCFDAGADAKSILQKNKNIYIYRHDLDEIGIGQDQIVEELLAVIELLKPYLNLLPLEKIEKKLIDDTQ